MCASAWEYYAREVGTGLDDYYAGTGEAPGAATRIRAQARRDLLEAFGHQPAVFDTIIRASERGAIDQSRHGVVALEYAHAASDARRFAAAAHTLAGDYRALADEILERITHQATSPDPTG